MIIWQCSSKLTGIVTNGPEWHSSLVKRACSEQNCCRLIGDVECMAQSKGSGPSELHDFWRRCLESQQPLGVLGLGMTDLHAARRRRKPSAKPQLALVSARSRREPDVYGSAVLKTELFTGWPERENEGKSSPADHSDNCHMAVGVSSARDSHPRTTRACQQPHPELLCTLDEF